MNAPNETAGSLDWWIDDRRSELRLRWATLADNVGITTEALRKIRSSGSMRTTTKRAIEQELQWERGSIDAILNGGEPTTDDRTREDIEPPEYLREAREMYDEALRRFARWESEGGNREDRKRRGA